MQSPELTLIIARSMRTQTERKPATMHTLPRTSAFHAFRSTAGNALVTIGSWIAQEPRTVERNLSARDISLAGSTER